VAKPLLAQIGGRPLTLVRCSQRTSAQLLLQKHVKDGVPSAVGTVPIREDDGVATYMRVDDMAGLVASAQLGTLEIHTWAVTRTRSRSRISS
jgi:bifunctional non-homologous end joining protein LigD